MPSLSFAGRSRVSSVHLPVLRVKGTDCGVGVLFGPGDFSLSAFGGKDAEGDFCGTAKLTGASAKERIGGGAFEGDNSVFDGGLAVPGFPALEFFAEGIVFDGFLFVAAIFADTD